LKLQNEPISFLQSGIDNLIYGLSVDYGSDAYPRWAKNPLGDKTIARVGETDLVTIKDVVEKGSKMSTPTIPGALFSRMGQRGKKGKGFIRGNTVNSSPSKFFCKPTKYELIATYRVFFPSLPDDIPGKP
jgi:hypothetical protein